MNEPEEIESTKGGMIPRKLTVEYISFSAHVDYSQNSEFIELVKAQHVVSLFQENNFFPTLFLGTSSWRTNCDGTVEGSYDSTV